MRGAGRRPRGAKVPSHIGRRDDQFPHRRGEKPAEAILSAYFSDIPAEEREGVQFFVSDMYDGFRAIKKRILPEGRPRRRSPGLGDGQGEGQGVQEAGRFVDRRMCHRLPIPQIALEAHRQKGLEGTGEGLGETERSIAAKTERVKGILAKKPGLLEIYDAIQALYKLVEESRRGRQRRSFPG